MLSTEHEAPKRALESAKSRLKRRPKRGSESEEEVADAGEQAIMKNDGESAETPPGGTI